MAIILPTSRRSIQPIQTPQQQIPLEQIVAAQGANPLATGIETAGNVIGKTLQKRAALQKQGQQLALASKVTGIDLPPEALSSGMDADTFVKLAEAKANLANSGPIFTDTPSAPVSTTPVSTPPAVAGSPSQPPAPPAQDQSSRINSAIQKIKKGDFSELNTLPKQKRDTLMKMAELSRKEEKPPTPMTNVWQDPSSGQVSASSKPGWLQRSVTTDKAVALLSSNYNQGATRDRPTAQTRASAEFATTIIPHIDSLRNLITEADQKGYIGPAAGRVYGDFMAGKVGTTGDPDADRLLGQLRSTDSLLKTGAMKVHFGSRGGSNMYDHFSDMLNTGKQSAPMLNGSLDGIESFMQGYADAGKPKSSASSSSNLKTITPKKIGRFTVEQE